MESADMRPGEKAVIKTSTHAVTMTASSASRPGDLRAEPFSVTACARRLPASARVNQPAASLASPPAVLPPQASATPAPLRIGHSIRPPPCASHPPGEALETGAYHDQNSRSTRGTIPLRPLRGG